MGEWLLNFAITGVMGFFLQHLAFVVGMHAIARHRIVWSRVLLVSAVCAMVLWGIRSLPMLQFGVHTMLNCLITNLGCVMVCRMDIRKSVLGSIVMMILILLSDLVNFGVLMMILGKGDITAFLQTPMHKAISALPGNFTLMAVAMLMYRTRIRRAEAV